MYLRNTSSYPLVSGIKILYIGGQVFGIVATFCMFYLSYTPRIYILSIFSGIMYSTIMTFPYLLLVRYHKTDVVSYGQARYQVISRSSGTIRET